MRCNLRSSAEYETKAPIRVYPKLLDIIHCPRKDGASVMKVLDQQFESVGASHHDFVSGSGDGGGENEGVFKHFPLFCTQTHVKQLAAHKQADKDNSNQTNERKKTVGYNVVSHVVTLVVANVFFLSTGSGQKHMEANAPTNEQKNK